MVLCKQELVHTRLRIVPPHPCYVTTNFSVDNKKWWVVGEGEKDHDHGSERRSSFRRAVRNSIPGRVTGREGGRYLCRVR